MPRLCMTIVAISVATAAAAQDAMPVATVGAIKEATAYILTDVDSEPESAAMSGSGFLIRAHGTTGYVVTNSHVITPTARTTPATMSAASKSKRRSIAPAFPAAPYR